MPVLVPDEDRKFPLQHIPYLDMRIDDLFANAIEIKRANCPDWTDESISDFGIQLLWLYAVLAKWQVDNMNRIKNNLFIGSCLDRESMRALAELLDYDMAEAGAASVSVEFTCQSGHPEFVIPEGSKVSTSGVDSPIVFETSSDQVVGVGVNTISVACIQGETIGDEIIGSSDGSQNQRYSLSVRPVVWESETVEVFDGAAWTAWTRVDDFIESDGDDNHYRIEVNEVGVYYIVFGDNERGRIPQRGASNIRASYRTGGGKAGNVAAGTITELLSSVQYIESITNPLMASGGTDRETLEHARLFIPAHSRIRNHWIGPGDCEILANSYISTQYGGIATSKAIQIGGWKVSLMIVPRSGGNPSSDLKNELLLYLGDKSRHPVCISLTIKNPNYKIINLDITVNAMDNFAPSQIAINVRNNLFKYISPIYQDPDTGLFPYGFGRNIYKSDLYRIIDSTAGVDYLDLNAPTDNVIVQDYEIADLGTVTITVTTPTGETSHFTLESGQ